MTHGTPQGYADGCRGAASCSNHGSIRMTCTQAAIRYRGDYSYMTAVDNGTATDAKEVFVVKVPRVVRETKVAAKKRATDSTPAKPKARKVGSGFGSIGRPRPKRIQKHGTINGANRGCKEEDCPNVAAGGLSCLAVRRNHGRNYWRSRQDHEVVGRVES